MELFWKTAAAVLLALVLVPALEKTEKDFSVLLTMAVCAMAAMAAISYLKPVLDLLWQLRDLGDLAGQTLEILLKAVGIGMVAEIAGMICRDAGNGSMGKSMQILASAVILYLSIPLLKGFLSLIQEILGQV